MRCPRCAEPVEPLRFCESCGQDLWRRSAGQAMVPPDEPCPGCGQYAGAEAGYCLSCGLRRPDGTEHVEADLGVLAGVSDRGRVHPRNEDAMAIGRLAAPGEEAVLAAVVCDGVSSVRRPELASRAAADTALEVLLGTPSSNGAEARVREAVAASAAAVAALAGVGEPDAPACTLVCAVVRAPEGEPPEITVGWAGDSRAYWLAEDGAALLTVDHSWAVQMVAAGLLDEATAMTDPNAHAITRWLGVDGVTEPEVTTWRPAGPGVLLLCSDGLWNYLPDPADLAALTLPVVERDGPLAAASALTAVALDSGGHDNITAVVIPVSSAAIRGV